jgi:hypothetical protein
MGFRLKQKGRGLHATITVEGAALVGKDGACAKSTLRGYQMRSFSPKVSGLDCGCVVANCAPLRHPITDLRSDAKATKHARVFRQPCFSER